MNIFEYEESVIQGYKENFLIPKIEERIAYLRKLATIGCGMSIEELTRVLEYLKGERK